MAAEIGKEVFPELPCGDVGPVAHAAGGGRYHVHQITKLNAELAAPGLSDLDVEAIEWALSRHRQALRRFGIFAV